MNDLKIAFFGTPQIAVWVLEELERVGIIPGLIVTNPDRPQGRKMLLTPPPVKIWATEHSIPTIQPTTLNVGVRPLHSLTEVDWDLFVVVAYGRILKKEILDIPKHGVLNIHPSLLPLLRGASPIRSAILEDMRTTGVTVMKMDEEMDHGPIVAQKEVTIPEEKWPIRGPELDERLAREGGMLLAETIPQWVSGEIDLREQDHSKATYCKKITKEMGEINLSDNPYKNLLKILAFDGWPGTFFFTEKDGKKMRVKITDADLAPDGSLQINKVIPEGKKEIRYSDFLTK